MNEDGGLLTLILQYFHLFHGYIKIWFLQFIIIIGFII